MAAANAWVGQRIAGATLNDGFFETYEPLSFGYGEVNIGGSPTVRIPDLSGRSAGLLCPFTLTPLLLLNRLQKRTLPTPTGGSAEKMPK